MGELITDRVSFNEKKDSEEEGTMSDALSPDIICKNVLCYGDSNTYGYNPANDQRYPQDIRWTGKLQKLLGTGYHIIEEGCNSRTTVFDDPEAEWKNGLYCLKPCLYSHKPVDIVILMLGTNDLKEEFHATPENIAEGAEKLVTIIRDFTREVQGFIPRILLVAPARIGDGIADSPFRDSFSVKTIEYSKALPALYRKVAEKYGCEFINAAEYATPSELDSLHFMPEDHDKLAKAFAEAIKAGDRAINML